MFLQILFSSLWYGASSYLPAPLPSDTWGGGGLSISQFLFSVVWGSPSISKLLFPVAQGSPIFKLLLPWE